MDRHGAALTGPPGHPGRGGQRSPARRIAVGAALIVPPLAFLAVFFVYPLASIVVESFTRGDGDVFGSFSDVVSDAGLRHVIWFTVWQAAVSTALTLLVGLPGAYVFARYIFPGKGIIRAATTVAFVLPTVVVGSAFLALLGPGGLVPVDLVDTVWAIFIAHVFFNYAVVLRTVGGFWSHLDPRAVDAARVLGASRLQAFRSITLPLLRPAISSAALIVFLFTLTSFGVVLLLGGPTHATVEVEIYRQTTQFLNLPIAAALAILQLLAVTAVLIVYGRSQERRSVHHPLRAAGDTARKPRGVGPWTLIGVNLTFVVVLIGAPIAVLVQRSFSTAGGYGLRYYRELASDPRGSTLFVPPVEAIRNSLVFACVATTIAVGLAVMIAVLVVRPGAARRGLDILVMLPLGASAVTLGFGFLIALDQPPLDLRSSPWLIPIAHALVATPFVVRVLVPVLRSLDPRLREAAGVLGAGPIRAWREVDLPIVGRALAVGAGFAFAISMGEFGATAFIARPDYPTIPIAIFRFLGQPGALNFGQAMAMSTILVVVTATVVMLIDRVRVGTVGEF